MKKVLLFMTSFLVVCAMIFAMNGPIVRADASATSGYCGRDDKNDDHATNIQWELVKKDDGNYTLRLTGTGEMSTMYNVPDSSMPIYIPGAYFPYAPWSTYRNQITSVEIGEGITTLARSCFAGTRITSVTLPSTIKKINDYAFMNCTSLKTMQLNEGLEEVGKANFENQGITSITLPSTLKSITGDNFRYLTTDQITINGGASAQLKIDHHCLYSVDGKTVFTGAPDENGVLTIPEGVETIASCAFEHKGEKSILFPSTLKTIGDYAFNFCPTLEGELVIPDSVTKLGEGAFCQANYTSIVVGSGVKKVEMAFAKCEKLQKVVFKGVESLFMAFEFDSALTDVSLPETLTEIKTYAFFKCTSLTSITIPSSVKTIGEYAFEDAGLTSIVIPEGVEKIENGAFKGTKLTSLTLPSSCTSFSTNDVPENCTLEKKASARTTAVIPVSDPKLPDLDAQEATTLPDLSIPQGYTQTDGTVTPKKNDNKGAKTKKAAQENKGRSDLKGSHLRPLLAKVTSSKITGIRFTYKKVKGASYYGIYGAKDGENITLISKLKGTSVNIMKVNKKKLVKNQYYHLLVMAYNKKGKVLATSKTVHTTTGRYANIQKIKIKNPKKVMKKKQSYTLKLKVTSSKGKQKTYRKISYESSNPSIVKISQNGKVKASKKGKATLYIYGQNGVYTTVNVLVK